MRGLIIYLTRLSLLLGACRSTRNIQTAIIKKDTVTVIPEAPVPTHADTMAFIEEQFNRIKRNRIAYTTSSAKIDVGYTDGDGKKYDVNAHVRMYRDSVIWVSVTGMLGIEGLRAYITRDSVRILDKQNKMYTLRSVGYLQEVTALPLDLNSLQDLLIGNPVYLDTNIVSYDRNEDRLSLLSLGSFFKNLFTVSVADHLMASSKLDDIDELRNRTCYLSYSEYDTKKGVPFPLTRTITVSEKKQLDIRLHFRQYDFNEMLSFPFRVDKNYTRN